MDYMARGFATVAVWLALLGVAYAMGSHADASITIVLVALFATIGTYSIWNFNEIQDGEDEEEAEDVDEEDEIQRGFCPGCGCAGVCVCEPVGDDDDETKELYEDENKK